MVPPAPFVSADDVDVDDSGEIEVSSFKPPPASPAPTFDPVLVGAVGELNWYRSLPFAAVPVLDLGGGSNGLLTLAGILPPIEEGEGDGDGEGGESSETPLVVVAFESQEDAERLAFVWHCSGAARAAGAEIGSLRAMTPEELDGAAESLGGAARAVVFKRGALRLAPGTPADALLAALAAGAAEQLLLSSSSSSGSSGGGGGGGSGVVDV